MGQRDGEAEGQVATLVVFFPLHVIGVLEPLPWIGSYASHRLASSSHSSPYRRATVEPSEQDRACLLISNIILLIRNGVGLIQHIQSPRQRRCEQDRTHSEEYERKH